MLITEEYVRSIFAQADAFNAAGFADAFAEDGTFIFGVNPVVKGRKAIEQANANFFSSLQKMHHQFHHIWIEGDTSIAEATAHYTRPDGHEVALPVVTIFFFEAGKIKEDRIYMDITPLFQNPMKP